MTLDELITRYEKTKKAKSAEGFEARLQEQDEYANECFESVSEYRKLIDYLKLLKRILDSGDCNVCAIRECCNVVPELGEMVRYNCPMFVRKEV